MKTLGAVNLYDFYFNGKYLSSMGGIVAGKDGFKEYSLLPSRDTKTQRTIGSDETFILNSKLNPREFSVPVLFQDDGGIEMRDIAGWLDSEDAQDFYFKDDTIKLKAKLNNKEIMLSTFSSFAGLTEIPFIAYDPFFYEITPTQYTFTTTQVFTNIGNKICIPKIEITTSASATIIVQLLQNSVAYYSFSMTGLNGYCCIDSKAFSVVDSNGLTLFDKYTKILGDTIFPMIKTGVNTISVTGSNITSAKLTPNFRWI